MKSPFITKLGDVETPIGWASLLQVRGRQVLSFPEVIDRDNKTSMETYYGTLQWPKPLPLSRISDFPPGPALSGYFLISLEDIYESQPAPKYLEKTNQPRHVREFLRNVLAGLAASLLIGKG